MFHDEKNIWRTWIRIISICSTIQKIEILSSQVLQSQNAPPFCDIAAAATNAPQSERFTILSAWPLKWVWNFVEIFVFSNSWKSSLKLENEEVVSTSTTWGPPSVTTTKSGTGVRVSGTQSALPGTNNFLGSSQHQMDCSVTHRRTSQWRHLSWLKLQCLCARLDVLPTHYAVNSWTHWVLQCRTNLLLSLDCEPMRWRKRLWTSKSN